MTVDVSPGVQVLTVEECSALLEAHRFGRIGVQGPEGPGIFPVNYVWVTGHIVIRTSPGTRPAAAAQSVVAFEIDGIDEPTRTGWSVLVVGTAYEVTDSVDDISEALRRLPVDSWAPGPKTSVLRIEPRSVSGRRITGEGFVG